MQIINIITKVRIIFLVLMKGYLKVFSKWSVADETKDKLKSTIKISVHFPLHVLQSSYFDKSHEL